MQNTTAEEISLLGDQLEIVSGEISSIRETLKSVVTKSDIEQVISSSVSKLILELETRLKNELEAKLKDQTKELNEKIEGLQFENCELKEKYNNLLKSVESEKLKTNDKISETQKLAQDAMRKANYNEQYSRKNNIKIMGISGEKEPIQELENKVLNALEQQGIRVDSSEILAIHRIPSKVSPKPVLIKLTNNEVKTRVMRHRKNMKAAGHRLVDDVTQLNTGLINRLNNHQDIDKAWYFNGSVFATNRSNQRFKFDLFDSVAEILASSSVPYLNRQ